MRILSLLLTALLLAAPVLHAQNSEIPLRPGDRVTVTIGGVPPEEVQQISKLYTVSDGGTINLLHISEVQASGMKPSSLQRAIEQTYKSQEIYTNPTVTVSIDDMGSGAPSRTVYVSGVNVPGPKPYKPGLTAMQAIMAGGRPTPYGKLSKTTIIRTLTNGTRETISRDLSKYSRDPSVDVELQPEDQIIVPE